MFYSSYEELHNLIKSVLDDNYAVAAANIIYLEELTSKSHVIYMAQFRDILTHLSHIYEYDDIFEESSKDAIIAQLERIKGHLERIVIDSYQKIYMCLLQTIEDSVTKTDRAVLKTQIAQQIKDLRVSKGDLSFSQKKQNFQKLIAYMEAIINKFHLTFTD